MHVGPAGGGPQRASAARQPQPARGGAAGGPVDRLAVAVVAVVCDPLTVNPASLPVPSVPTDTPAPTEEATPVIYRNDFYTVIGLSPDDTLNLRTGPGVQNPIVAKLDPATHNIRMAQGESFVNGSTWVFINVEEQLGWVNLSFLAVQEGRIESAVLRRLALRVAYLLRNQDLVAIAEIAHPKKGVRFAPQSFLSEADLIFSAEEVANLMDKYNLVVLPVVDALGRLVGRITIDDIVDVRREEETEDLQKMAGMEALDEPYMNVSIWGILKKRAGWLVILFLGETLTATGMGFFENEIAKVVILSLFVPLIISSGGNTGSQASTLVIRALALGEITIRNWWTIIQREIKVKKRVAAS